jgi:hypothetical protein
LQVGFLHNVFRFRTAVQDRRSRPLKIAQVRQRGSFEM